MKKSYSIPLLLAAFLISLSVVSCDSNKSAQSATATGVDDSQAVIKDGTLSIAYVNIDSLLVNYNYSKDLQEKFMRKAEANQATINQQGRKLEDEMRDFQYKLENNAFFNQDRARSEQERLLKKQQEFQELNQRLSAEMMKEQNEMNKLLSDSIMSQVREWNRIHGRYQLILSNAGNDNLLYADEAFDITKQVVEYLNSKYTAPKETEKK